MEDLNRESAILTVNGQTSLLCNTVHGKHNMNTHNNRNGHKVCTVKQSQQESIPPDSIE